MPEVPARYIADLPADWAGELGAILDVSSLVGGVRVPPPAIGHLALLEHIDAAVVARPAEADRLDCLRALFIMVKGRESAALALVSGECRAKFDQQGDWSPLDKSAVLWAMSHVSNASPLSAADFAPIFAAAFAGFGLIPDAATTGRERLFGPESVAAILVLLEGLGIDRADATWRLPLCLVGHIAAVRAQGNGTKGVGRPKDPADVRLQLRLAAEREARGELHPWQVAEPDKWPLTDKQREAANG
jgi:hypothetical protein